MLILQLHIALVYIYPISLWVSGAIDFQDCRFLAFIYNKNCTLLGCPQTDFSPFQYTTEETGREQLEGEYKGMMEMYNAVSGLVPRPYGHGRLRHASQPTYFFVCEFVHISDALPDPVRLGVRLAELHRNSLSPTGKFGFHIPTYDGKLPQVTDWDSSWTSFFRSLLAGVARLDAATNGAWKELDSVVDRTLNQAVPRLLGVLESEGRSVKPSLIHGDLWDSNIGTEYETRNIYIFDAVPYYAHNEMELRIWRTEHHRMKKKAYKREYLRNFEPSEPGEEFDDRNRLYSVKPQLMYSARVPGTSVRNQ